MSQQLPQPAVAGRGGGDEKDATRLREGGSIITRRNRTEGYEESRAILPSVDQQMPLDESFSDLPAPSLSSIPTRSSSWETNSVSEGEDKVGRNLRRDRRKFIDTTTPTLVDEDASGEEEEEIVSLETEKVRREIFVKNEASLRRTPGASMDTPGVEQRPASLRRTPGASAMHQSSKIQHTPANATDDSAILKFGLNLSTPVAAGSRVIEKESRLAPVKSMDSYSSSGSSDSPSTEILEAHRPPRVPSSATRPQEQRENLSYTPAGWTLSKNPHLEVSQGSFSPYTLRLTEDIDNLLLDEDDNSGQALLARQQVFRNQLKSVLSVQSPIHATDEAEDDATESWMKSYIFDQDGGSAASSKLSRPNVGRSRRGSGRRSRGGETTKEDEVLAPLPQQKPTPVRHTQGTSVDTQFSEPKPVRHTQGTSVDTQFSVGNLPSRVSASAPYSSEMTGTDVNHSGPRPLNFGGAFVPPSKDSAGSFRRFVPPPSESQPDRDLPFRAETTNLSDSVDSKGRGNEKAFAPMPPSQQGRAYKSSYQFGFQSAQPAQPVDVPPYMMSAQRSQLGSTGPSGEMGFHGHLHPSGYGRAPMGGPASQNSNMPMGFIPMGTYQMQQPSMPHHMGQPYAPLHARHNPHPSFAQPSWSPMLQYPAAASQREAGWQPQNMNEEWGHVNEFGYRMVDPRMQMTPSPQFNTWPDGDLTAADLQQYPHQLNEHGTAQAFGAISVSPLPPAMLGALPPTQSTKLRRETQKRDRRVAKAQKTAEQGRAGRKKASSDKAGKKKEPATSPMKKAGPASPKKKKQTGESSPSKSKGKSTAESQEDKLVDDTSAKPDDPADAKRAELVESPVTRAAFKDFCREFRAKERSSSREAEEYALKAMNDGHVPEKIHWRVYLELADQAKRANKFNDARKLYRTVCQLQPYASQGWLEYSKLEEECGHLSRCSKILHTGLAYCELSENLLTRAIKHEEKMGNIDLARQLLARLKHAGIEKVWRTVLEGALMEARVGNAMMARKVLKVLMRHVPWYGPLYLEAYRLEKELGRHVEALAIVERGLSSIPRYGPLWFGAFRLSEVLDNADGATDLPRTTAMFQRATTNISRELIWKVNLEAAQIYERNTNRFTADKGDAREECLRLCRQRFAMTVTCCPPNLSWKVWLASGRMELSTGSADKARLLFLRAKQVVPEKGRVATLLECARLEEFIGKPDLARAILCKGRLQNGSDWKLWLESVLLEVRSGHYHRAIDFTKRALEMHSGTGRLWAALIQLRFYDGGEDAQYAALKRALRAVPKSGEVWCEGGRVHMNPFSKTFDLAVGRRHLFFATRFTPQYGDSFLEALKLELLEHWVAPVAFNLWKTIERSYTDKLIDRKRRGSGCDDIVSEVVRRTVRLVRQAFNEEKRNDGVENGNSDDEEIVASLREGLDRKFFERLVDNSDLELRCANADPNYGLLWFYCRQGQIDSARTVIAHARELFASELIANADIYVAAIIRRFALIVALKHEGQSESSGTDDTKDRTEPTTADFEDLDDGWETLLEARLRYAPSLDSMLNERERDEKSDVVLLESSMSGSDFLTGLVELNKFRPLQDMSLVERRKAIFGSDALFS